MLCEEKRVEKKQIDIAVIICILVSFPAILACFNIVCNRIFDEAFIYDTIICVFIAFVFFVKGVLSIAKKIKVDVLIIYFTFALAWLLTILLFPQNEKWMFTNWGDILGNPVYVFYVFSLGGYMFARYITDYQVLDKYLYYFSVGVIIISFIAYAISYANKSQMQYMTFSYNMLLHVAFVIIRAVEKRNIFDIMLGIVGTILIFIAGARGPLVCLGATVIIYIILGKTEKKKKVVRVLILAGLFATAVIFFDDIIGIIIKTTREMGLNSRTLETILQGQFFNDSGRGIIQRNIMDSFSVTGMGLYGDRALAGTYAHNLFIELSAQWGIALGTIIFGAILICVIRGVRCTQPNAQRIVIILLSAGFFKLFFSGSYLNQEPTFFVLMGLGVNALLSGKSLRKKGNTK